MQTYIDISDDDLNHLIKIFDPRRDGWVNHGEFVYPVYSKLNRDGISVQKDEQIKQQNESRILLLQERQEEEEEETSQENESDETSEYSHGLV